MHASTTWDVDRQHTHGWALVGSHAKQAPTLPPAGEDGPCAVHTSAEDGEAAVHSTSHQTPRDQEGQGQDTSIIMRSGSLPTAELNPVKRLSIKEQLAARFGRTKSVSEIAAEKTMELIARLKSGLADVEKKRSQTLNSCQSLLDACGDAIAQWFKGLSGKALQRAIKEAFDKFDTDGSGRLDEDEFAQAMHVLGLRLSKDEYKVLFAEYDADGSGEIDLEEFTHMVKKFLKLPCAEDDCNPCTSGDPELSNQPREVYRKNWADDDAVLAPAASVVQGWARSALVRKVDGSFAQTACMDKEELKPDEMTKIDDEKLDEMSDEEEARKRARETVPAKNDLEETYMRIRLDNSDETREQERLRRAEEKQRRRKEIQDALANEQNALISSEIVAGHRRGKWDDGFLSKEFSRFARTASAPPHRRHQDPLLSEEEVEAVRKINDDSFLEDFFRNTVPFWEPRTHIAPKRLRQRACPPGCEACCREVMWLRLMQRQEPRTRYRKNALPNRNLNHNCDRCVFRGDAPIFLSEMPSGQEIFDHDFFLRTRSAPVEAGLIDHESITRDGRAFIDPWPGCRSPFQAKAELVLVPVSPVQHEKPLRQRAMDPVLPAWRAAAVAHAETHTTRLDSNFSDSRTLSSSLAQQKLALRGCSPLSSPVGFREVESRHEKGSADLEARTRGEERVGGVGGSGNAGGSGPVQDFTWLLSSSAMSSFVEKHLIRQPSYRKPMASSTLSCKPERPSKSLHARIDVDSQRARGAPSFISTHNSRSSFVSLHTSSKTPAHGSSSPAGLRIPRAVLAGRGGGGRLPHLSRGDGGDSTEQGHGVLPPVPGAALLWPAAVRTNTQQAL